MACHLLGTEPLPEQNLTCWQLDLKNLREIWIQMQTFSYQKNKS